MRYRIEYTEKRCCDIVDGRQSLIEKIKRENAGTIADIRKLYKSGASDSVMDTYKQYIL